MITEKEHKNRENLFELMKQYPDFPVIPMVDSEIVPDDTFDRYIGAFGCAYIDEYMLPKHPEEAIFFKSDDDLFYTLEKYLNSEEFDALPEDENECRKIYDNLPWIKAIIMNVDLPE